MKIVDLIKPGREAAASVGIDFVGVAGNEFRRGLAVLAQHRRDQRRVLLNRCVDRGFDRRLLLERIHCLVLQV